MSLDGGYSQTHLVELFVKASPGSCSCLLRTDPDQAIRTFQSIYWENFDHKGSFTYKLPILQVFTRVEGNAGERVKAGRGAEERLVPLGNEDTARVRMKAG